MVSHGDEGSKFVWTRLACRIRGDISWRAVLLDGEPGRPPRGVRDHPCARHHAGVEEGKFIAGFPVDVPGDTPATRGTEVREVGVEEVRVIARLISPVDIGHVSRPVNHITHVIRVAESHRDVEVDQRRKLRVLKGKHHREPVGGCIRLVEGEEEVRLQDARCLHQHRPETGDKHPAARQTGRHGGYRDADKWYEGPTDCLGEDGDQKLQSLICRV